MEMDEKQFTADLVDFVEEHWMLFLDWASERDYTQSDIEEMFAKIRKRDGRA